MRATAVLASGSFISILASIAAMKLWALIVGPVGLGYLAVLQSLLGVGAIVACLGLQNGVVKLLPQALQAGDEVRVSALRRATELWGWRTGAAAALLIIVLHAPISRLLLHDAERTWPVAVVGAALLLTVRAQVAMGLLNAHRRVRALATVTMLSGVGTALISVTILLLLGEAGIPWVVLGTPVASLLAAEWKLRREVPPPMADVPAAAVTAAGRDLVAFGGPFMLSSLAGTGVQVALPLLVLQYLSTADVGFYRAAAAAGIGYFGFLFTAMGQEYFPRLAAVASDPEALRRTVDGQLRFVTHIALPLVVVGVIVTPLMLIVLYDRSFLPATEVLRWHWVGNLFRFWAWALSFVILTRMTSRVFLLTEVLGGSTLLITSLLGMQLYGLAGLGVAYAATNAAYLALVSFIVQREIDYVPSPQNMAFIAASCAIAIAVMGMPRTGGLWLGLAAALALSVVAGSLWGLRHDYRQQVGGTA